MFDFPTAALDSVFYTESSANFYAYNFFQTYYFSFRVSHSSSFMAGAYSPATVPRVANIFKFK